MQYPAKNILGLALELGSRILECGGEISRTEDTVERVCLAYGASSVQVFSIVTLVMATIHMPDGETCTKLRRVSSTSFDFGAMEELNSLSRHVCASLPHPREILDKLPGRSRERELLRPLGGILSGAAFTLLFGGGLLDAVAAAIVGGLIIALERLQGLSRFAHILISSFVGGTGAIMLCALGLGSQPDLIMIGVIMLVIPGLSFSTSIKEMLSGDIVAGSLRMLQTFIATGAIAAGFTGAMALWGGI